MKQLYMRLPLLLLTLTGAILCYEASAQIADQPMGWASFGSGTTGGAGGDTVIATSRSELNLYANSTDTLVIMIQDTIELIAWERMDVGSNKTILGMGYNAAITKGGLEVKGDNVIIRNVSIGDSYDGDWSGETHSTDALTIYGRNVWIDHCEFYASADGLLDIRADNGVAADFITVSYCKFSNHNKVMLIGSSDNEIEDRNHLKTTIYRCWFDGTFNRGIHQRMPRVRFGDIHVLNTYYESIGSYCVGARFESDIVVENTYFRDSHDPHLIDDVGLGNEDPSIVAEGNIYELSFGHKQTAGTAFDPHIFYDIEVADAIEVPAIVLNGAGKYDNPGNLSPVAVNDTLKYDGSSGLKIVDVVANDLDADGGVLKVASVINQPKGTVFIQDNTVLYASPSNEVGLDTVVYQLVDTQGGLDTAMILVINQTLPTGDPLPDAEPRVTLYPNPVEGHQAFVSVAGFDLSSLNMGVYDSSGREMSKTFSPDPMHTSDEGAIFSLNCSELRAGTYVVVMNDGERAGSASLVIAR